MVAQTRRLKGRPVSGYLRETLSSPLPNSCKPTRQLRRPAGKTTAWTTDLGPGGRHVICPSLLTLPRQDRGNTAGCPAGGGRPHEQRSLIHAEPP